MLFNLDMASRNPADSIAVPSRCNLTLLTMRLRESRNSASICNLVTETELQLLFIGMINSERVNNVTS